MESNREPFQADRTWFRKFRNAFGGLIYGIRDQKSFWIHLPVAVCVVIVGIWVQVSIVEMSILLGCIALVVSLELVNSSLEAMARSITDQYCQSLGRALDIASAAVLLAALLSAIIGMLILGPKMLGWAA